MSQDELSRHSVDGAVLLLTCLRGLPFIVPHDMEWQSLLKLASTHGVLLLVHQSLLERGVEIPDFFAAAVQEHKDAAETLAAKLEGLLKQFAERGIDVLPLKGPVLAERLYGNATMRSSNDLDLLVRREDFQRAELLLTDRGFVAREAADDYHRRFVHDGVPVELHFEVASPRYFPFDLEGVWSRARRAEFRGHPVHIVSTDDLVLFLCLHGLKHGFSRLIWILDVARALEQVPDYGFEELTRRAQRQGLEPWLLIGSEVLREIFPQQLPREIDTVIAKSPRAAERARHVAARLLAEGLDEINDHKIRSFYLQTECSMHRRWRCRFSFFAPTVEDHAWAERHRIYRPIVPFLRPFRLLKKYRPSKVWRVLFPRQT